MNTTFSLWKSWNIPHEKLVKILPTRNVVGEIGELLAMAYLKGTKETNLKSFDILGKDGLKYQVKTRQLDKMRSTPLNVIRSWDFDKLIVIIFNTKGLVSNAIVMDALIVKKKYAKKNTYQNGFVVTASTKFFSDESALNITSSLNEILNKK